MALSSIRCPKDPRQQLFTAVRENRDYWPLYPSKGWSGTSQAFYEFYQERVCGWHGQALVTAKRLARLTIENTEPKHIKDLRKPEAFKAVGNRSAIRRLMANHVSIDD